MTERIEEALRSWKFGSGDLLICGGARGGDLIAATVADRLGATVWILLAEAPDDFERNSVAGSAEHWVDEFRTFVDRVPTLVLAERPAGEITTRCTWSPTTGCSTSRRTGRRRTAAIARRVGRIGGRGAGRHRRDGRRRTPGRRRRHRHRPGRLNSVGHEAFISYRHGVDAEVAAAVERGLERLARPWNRLRAMSVFRDDSNLAAESDLTRAITNALDETQFLILIASPESAQSKWVDKEVIYWCDQRRAADRLIIVVSDGEFAWDEEADELSASSTPCRTAVRRGSPPSRCTSICGGRDRRPTCRCATRGSARRSCKSPPRSAVSRRKTSRARTSACTGVARRLAKTAVASVVILALVASLAAVVAVANARRADRRARRRSAGSSDWPPSTCLRARPTRHFLLSLVAADLDSGDNRFDAARALIGRYSRLDEMLYAPDSTTGIRGIGISPSTANRGHGDRCRRVAARCSPGRRDAIRSRAHRPADAVPTDLFLLDDGRRRRSLRRCDAWPATTRRCDGRAARCRRRRHRSCAGGDGRVRLDRGHRTRRRRRAGRVDDVGGIVDLRHGIGGRGRHGSPSSWSPRTATWHGRIDTGGAVTRGRGGPPATTSPR